MRGYASNRPPSRRVDATVLYSIRGAQCGFSVALGLRVGYERMAPVTSQLADQRLDTESLAYQAEVLLPISFGAVALQPGVGYFARRYAVAGDVVPLADYRSAGATLGRVPFHYWARVDAGARLASRGHLKRATGFPARPASVRRPRGHRFHASDLARRVLSSRRYILQPEHTADGDYPNVVPVCLRRYCRGGTLRLHTLAIAAHGRLASRLGVALGPKAQAVLQGSDSDTYDHLRGSLRAYSFPPVASSGATYCARKAATLRCGHPLRHSRLSLRKGCEAALLVQADGTGSEGALHHISKLAHVAGPSM